MLAKKSLMIAVAGVLAISGLAACSSSKSSSSSSSSAGGGASSGGASSPSFSGTITLGMVDDTSGGASAYSPYAAEGIQLAVDDINKAGGIMGKQVKLETQSDGSVTTTTPTIVRQLISDGASAIILDSGSASSVAAKPVCASANILCVAPANLSEAITTPPGADNMWILGPTSGGIGQVFAAAMGKIGTKRLAVVADDTPTITGYVPSLVSAITATGIQQVDLEKIPTTASDVSAQIARVKASNPDAVLVMSLGGQTEIVEEDALAQALPNVQRFTLASIVNQPTTWALADKGALKGLVGIGSIDTANPRTKTFADELTKAGGKYSTLTAYQPQGYDGVYLIKAAIEAAGGTSDVSKINTAFASITKYQAHYGRSDFTLSFSSTKHVGSDGNCGIVLTQFDASNKPTITWPTYQPTC
jgi:branched-chain amino acid transport system substrate-binding protein